MVAVSAYLLLSAAVVVVTPSAGGFIGLAQAEQGGCHPSYEGKCVPMASDVDCAGGGGDGPAFVEGPVRVVGRDVYRLDSDGDGIACEPRRG